MTTQSWSTVVDHSGDAGFRAWGLELSTKLAALGLVQTSDTGQINWTTVTRPGTGTIAGFEIWRFNDTMQSTAPIYMRFEYGTGNAAGTPRIWLGVGTGTNGSGTLTGTALTTQRNFTPSLLLSSNVIAYQSYACVVDGAFWLAWKVGANVAGVAYGAVHVARSCDSTGAATALGAQVTWGSGSNTNFLGWQNLRFASAASAGTFQTGAGSIQTVAVGLLTASITSSGNNQAYLWWGGWPEVSPIFSTATVLSSEVTSGSTVSVALVGTSARTYIRPGSAWHGDPTTSSSYSPIFIWE